MKVFRPLSRRGPVSHSRVRYTESKHQTRKFPSALHFHSSGISEPYLTKALLSRTYYDVLGVPKNASEDQIKKAFFDKAKRFHPDVNKGDPDAQKKFVEVTKSYQTLRDSAKRKEYDMSLGGSRSSQARQGQSSYGPFYGRPRPEQQRRQRTPWDSWDSEWVKQAPTSEEGRRTSYRAQWTEWTGPGQTEYREFEGHFDSPNDFAKEYQRQYKEIFEELDRMFKQANRRQEETYDDSGFFGTLFRGFVDPHFLQQLMKERSRSSASLPRSFEVSKRPQASSFDIFAAWSHIGRVDCDYKGNMALVLKNGPAASAVERHGLLEIKNKEGKEIYRVEKLNLIPSFIPFFGGAISFLRIANQRDELRYRGWYLRLLGERFWWSDGNGRSVGIIRKRWFGNQWSFHFRARDIDPSPILFGVLHKDLSKGEFFRFP